MNLPPFKLERYFAEYEFTTQYTLCSSDCESTTVGGLLALEPGAADAFQKQWLGYTESPGAPALREAIRRLYTTIEPAQVLVHSGAEEAIFLFMHAALEPGDHVVVHAPCYQSLSAVAQSRGVAVSFWQARERDGWALDLDELARLLRPNTRAIVLNTPHNPTGYLMTRQDFLQVTRMAAERGIVLFSDEVYREAEHKEADPLPAACDIDDRAVSLGVMSKTYGLAGLRIGWIATHNADLYVRMARLKDYTTICNGAPSEFLAELALRHRHVLIRRHRELFTRNLAVLDDFFARHADQFAWVRPRAGSIAFPRLLGEPVEAFCHALVTRSNVLLLPGTVFDDQENHFRIGYGRADLPQAIARVEDFLHARGGERTSTASVP